MVSVLAHMKLNITKGGPPNVGMNIPRRGGEEDRGLGDVFCFFVFLKNCFQIFGFK